MPTFPPDPILRAGPPQMTVERRTPTMADVWRLPRETSGRFPRVKQPDSTRPHSTRARRRWGPGSTTQRARFAQSGSVCKFDEHRLHSDRAFVSSRTRTMRTKVSCEEWGALVYPLRKRGFHIRLLVLHGFHSSPIA